MKYCVLHSDGKTVKEVFNKVVSGFTLNRDIFPCSDSTQEFWVLHRGQIVAPDDINLLKDRIDDVAGLVRTKYITQVPGQEATYMYKAAQADEYRASGYTGTVPLFVQAEADALGVTPQVAADNMLLQEAMWIVKGSQIEGVRMKWKNQLNSSLDRISIYEQAVAELNSL